MLLSMIRLKHITQGLNQEFFRAREVSWNKNTLIKSSFTSNERKAPQGNTSEFFLLDTLKASFEMRNLSIVTNLFNVSYKINMFLFKMPRSLNDR